MSPVRSGQYNRLWSEFQDVFSRFAAVSVQAFDEKGNVFHSAPELPPLCAYLQRFPETSEVCKKDCFQKVATCRGTCKILTARCHAGLSYRLVPMRRRSRPCAVILVGRVLNEVAGAEQYQGFIEQYKLCREAFLENLAGVRTLSSPELDRVATFAERLAFSFLASDARFERHHTLLERRRTLLQLAHHATTCTNHSPAPLRTMLELLRGILALRGAALLEEEGGLAVVRASVGLGEDAIDVLVRQDWPQLFRRHGEGALLALAGPPEMIGTGLEQIGQPLVAQRLVHDLQTVGYLVATGRALSGSDLDLFRAAASFMAAPVVYAKFRERAERKSEEARLLGLLAEKCLTAHSVEELLPLALEAVMHGLRAKRGSILLAEEKGRITAHALRGDHLGLSGSIKALQPGSVSHEVFFNRHALLVQDVDREPGLRREREYPYGTRSFVSVPLRENGNTLGVLHLTEREEVFTAHDLELLERLSLQAAVAIRKARLEEEVGALRVTSTIDHLTGVHNRRFLEEQLGIEFQRARRFGQPLSVAMLDVDGFSALNEELGRDYGDQVLRGIAAAVQGQLRSVDILARYEGDEFVLILPGTGAAGALNTLEKVRAKIAALQIAGEPSQAPRQAFSASAGLAVFPDTVTTADDLLRRADQALCRAKKSGRNSALLWSH